MEGMIWTNISSMSYKASDKHSSDVPEQGKVDTKYNIWVRYRTEMWIFKQNSELKCEVWFKYFFFFNFFGQEFFQVIG